MNCNELKMNSPNFYIHSSGTIYFIPMDLSAYSAAGKYVDQSWEYKNRLQTHECGNVETGTEAA